MSVPSADIEPTFGLMMLGDGTGAGNIRTRTHRKNPLKVPVPKPFVEVSIVELQPLTRETWILKHQAAVQTLFQRKMPRFPLEQIARNEKWSQILTPTEWAVSPAFLKKPHGPLCQSLSVVLVSKLDPSCVGPGRGTAADRLRQREEIENDPE
jgi:hypothetical protein